VIALINLRKELRFGKRLLLLFHRLPLKLKELNLVLIIRSAIRSGGLPCLFLCVVEEENKFYNLKVKCNGQNRYKLVIV
jgi:hypothetical protein